MQLYSVDQQRSQALEAHAAAFAQFKVQGLTNNAPFGFWNLKSCNIGGNRMSLFV